jgi:hypothetical protein
MTNPSPTDPDAAPVPAPATPAAAAAIPDTPSVPAAPAAAPSAPSPAASAASAPKPSPSASFPPGPRPPRGSAPAPAPSPDVVAPPAPAGRSALPVLTVIGFIFVLLALAWVWNSQLELSQRVAALSVPPPAPPPSVEPARVAALESRLTGLEQRLGEMESRPAPAPAPAPAPDASPAPASASGVDAAAAASLAAQVSALEARLKDDEQRQGALATRAALAERLQQAAAALEAGQPLGDLPDAPPALARFAHANPPTEAALRLAFPAAAAAAVQASRPSADGKSLGERILMHMSSLLTVKQAGRVVVGAPAATVLDIAQARLEAGDLEGALAALDALDSAAAQAMAGWRGDAKALLDARAALAQMAHG